MTPSARQANDSPGTPPVAVVVGDVAVDWNLSHRSPAVPGTDWDPRSRCTLDAEFGGVALLPPLLRHAATSVQAATGVAWTVHPPVLPRRKLLPTRRAVHQSYAVWSPYDGGTGRKAWRVSSHLGVTPAETEASTPGLGGPTERVEAPGLVVISDAGLGFRDQEELWGDVLGSPGGQGETDGPWVIYRVTATTARDGGAWDEVALWRRLVGEHARRLIVQVDAADLRRTNVQISRGLSWEKTAADVMEALSYHPRLSGIGRAAHAVVSFGAAGALLRSRDRARLAFDPAGAEGAFERRHPGGMIGYGTCLVAGLARAIMEAPEAPDLERGLAHGVTAARTLHRHGYRARGELDGPPRLAFPTAVVGATFDADPEIASVALPTRSPEISTARDGERGVRLPPWAILEGMHGEAIPDKAAEIVCVGLREALPHVPGLEVGALRTVDRREIEAYQAVAHQIERYCGRAVVERPLSFAVFGAPGSGKSFGIKQIARALFPDRIEPLTFNLSQFTDPSMLTDALHQVRDIAIAGDVPLVFWDEFDTTLGDRKLGWLRYFLAPMWDGEFQHGQLTHRIGRAIFVFAGGTAHRFEDFGSDLLAQDSAVGQTTAASAQEASGVEAGDAWRSVKGPDFISRLSGHVDVLGPNSFADPDAAVYEPDPFYLIRRAIILRSLLERFHGSLFIREGRTRRLSIDPGVLRALLHARRYRHGARSMEAVLAMSALDGRGHFDRSCLPPGAQLGLHIEDLEDFRLHIDRWEPAREELDAMARALHEGFCEHLEEQEFVWGEKTDYEADPPTHSALVDWEKLPPDEKEQNRDFVLDIPNKLRRIGLRLSREHTGQKLELDEDDPRLEALARYEHRRWVKLKLDRGWRWGKKTEKENRIHQALLPWEYVSDAESAEIYGDGPSRLLGRDTLPDTEKRKDRDLVWSIPRVLERGGYFVAPAEPPHADDAGEAT